MQAVIETTAPMWQTRPDWLTEAIDRKFETISTEIPGGYQFNGTDPNYPFGPTDFRSLVERQRAELARPLRILEVGCAAGHLITRNEWDDGDVVHGVTAFDYRKAPQFPLTPPEDSDSYLIGNAEKLDTIDGLLPKYDIVLSRYMVQHLIDKVGGIEQIANRVAPLGLLCLDFFGSRNTFAPLHTPRLHTPDLLAMLSRNDFREADLGPEAEATRALAREGEIILQRGHSERDVRFGMGYEKTDRAHVYRSAEHHGYWQYTQDAAA
jgi:SAM-dependent methyltransferase